MTRRHTLLALTLGSTMLLGVSACGSDDTAKPNVDNSLTEALDTEHAHRAVSNSIDEHVITEGSKSDNDTPDNNASGVTQHDNVCWRGRFDRQRWRIR